MTFGSLRAVDKAYEERDEEEEQKNLQKETQLKRDQIAQVSQQVSYFRTEKIHEAKEKSRSDKAAYESGIIKVT